MIKVFQIKGSHILEDLYLDNERHEGLVSHEMRKQYEQNDSEDFRNCVRARVHICLYFDLYYKYSKIYNRTEISTATEDREGERYRRETRRRNATFTGIMTILSQDSTITKMKFVYLIGD